MATDARKAELRRLWLTLRIWPWVIIHPMPPEAWQGEQLERARYAMRRREN